MKAGFGALVFAAASGAWAQTAGMIDPFNHKPVGIVDATKGGVVHAGMPVFRTQPSRSAEKDLPPSYQIGLGGPPVAAFSGYATPFNAGVQVFSGQSGWAGAVGPLYGLNPAQYGWLAPPCDWRTHQMIVVSTGQLGGAYSLGINGLARSPYGETILQLTLNSAGWAGQAPYGWGQGPFVAVPWPRGWQPPSVQIGLGYGCRPPQVWGPVAVNGWTMYPGRGGVWRWGPRGLEPIALPPMPRRD